MFVCRLLILLQINFSKEYTRNYQSVKRSVAGPGLGQNCLQRLSADDETLCNMGKFFMLIFRLLTFSKSAFLKKKSLE